jgi:hypothetical protein
MSTTPADRRLHPASFGAGAFFVLAGVVFLLEQLAIIELGAGVLFPLLLIGLGLAVVAEEAIARLRAR